MDAWKRIEQRLDRSREKQAAEAAARGELFKMTESERALVLCSDWFADRMFPPAMPLGEHFEQKGAEKKASGWVEYPKHPKGLLHKPCPVCGYRYGTAWIREEVQADIVEWLLSLPTHDNPISGWPDYRNED